MARKKNTPPAALAPDDGRQEYVLADGVTVVNSRKVTGRTVRLTLAEALFDLSLGRIVPVVAEPVPGETDEGTDHGRD